MSHDHSRSWLPNSKKYEPYSPHDRDLIGNDRQSRSDHPISGKNMIFFLLFIGPFWSKRCSQRFWYQKRNCQCYHPCQKYHSSCQKFPKIRWCESWYHFCSWWRLLATFDSWRIWNYCSGGWIWTCGKTCRGKLPTLKPWYKEPQYSEFRHIVH